MDLSQYLARYVSQHDLSAKYVAHFQTAVRCFGRYCAKSLEDIISDDLNAWADAELAKGENCKRTIKNKLSALARLMRAAAEEKLCQPLGKIKRIGVPKKVVVAFTPEDVARLIAYFKTIPGWFTKTGISKADFWEAVGNVAWDIGLRLGDLLELEWLDIDPETLTVAKIQSKTNRIRVGRLRPETWQVLQRLRPQGACRTGRYVFPFSSRRQEFCIQFKKHAGNAGVRGTSKYIRRGGATQVWITDGPAAAAQYLGHADGTGQLAWQNYVDRRQVQSRLAAPPPLPMNGHHSNGQAKPESRNGVVDDWDGQL